MCVYIYIFLCIFISSAHPLILIQITLTDNLGKLSSILEIDHFALVVHEQIQCEYSNAHTLPEVCAVAG